MKAILVDDERLALLQLNNMLKELPEIEVIGTYQDPLAAIEAAGVLQPDVVFLDINMPEIYGLKAAEHMQEACSDVEIVFVTAYDEYAIQAFELNALDYIMKPVKRERLARTVQRLLKNTVGKERERAHDPTLIRCLQSLQIDVPGSGTELLKWRTAKAQELFAYLLHHRGQTVRKGLLLELLWPDFETEKATTHLYTTIYQARKDLKRAGANIEIRSSGVKDGYILEAAQLRVDSEEWEQELRSLAPISADSVQDYQKVMDMYRGDYLADSDYLWAENERQRLRMLWQKHVQLLGEFYVRQGMLTEAMMAYLRMQQHDPYQEESYFALMRLHEQLGEKAAVEEQYRRLRSMLKQELDAEPGEKIVNWYERWKKASPA